MTDNEQARFDDLYQRHLTTLKLQGIGLCTFVTAFGRFVGTALTAQTQTEVVEQVMCVRQLASFQFGLFDLISEHSRDFKNFGIAFGAAMNHLVPFCTP